MGDHVGPQNERGQHELHVARQRFGIDDRQQIVLDEAFRISRLTRTESEPVLQGSQRADPTAELNKDSVGGCRKVKPNQSRPFGHGDTAQDDEEPKTPI